jgi:hypothetical protein
MQRRWSVSRGLREDLAQLNALNSVWAYKGRVSKYKQTSRIERSDVESSQKSFPAHIVPDHIVAVAAVRDEIHLEEGGRKGCKDIEMDGSSNATRHNGV